MWVLRGLPKGIVSHGMPMEIHKQIKNVGHGLGWDQGWTEADGARTEARAEAKAVTCTGDGGGAGVTARAWIRART